MLLDETLLIKITRIESVARGEHIIMNVWDSNNIKYSYYVDEKNADFTKRIILGATICVHVVEKENPKNAKYPYRNIYPGKQEDLKESAPLSPIQPEPPTELIPPNNGKYISKDEKIRWMNSINNAIHLLSHLGFKKNDVEKVKPLIVEFSNFLNNLKPNTPYIPQDKDTPIQDSQNIRMHDIKRERHYTDEQYHAMLSVIAGREIINTLDLTEKEAGEFITIHNDEYEITNLVGKSAELIPLSTEGAK